ncbi:MAG: aspartate-semialdehyde dehydrogenase [Coriobacteriales bacterium]|nr:aspartate-semialdehyde dehydrogenase [Coriobacteriales bacterium]
MYNYVKKEMPKNPVVAVAGATGAVGQEMLKVLEQRDFPASKVIPLASARSAGQNVDFKGEKLTIQELTKDSFEGVDIALFSAGGSISEEFAPACVNAGCVMIDNSSHFRMTDGVPLVVPEVNKEEAFNHTGIIANPNCSTIQMVVALKPLYDACNGIKRVVVSTYQAASGAGAKGMAELYNQTKDFLDGKDFEPSAFAHQIAFNTIPHIDVFMDDAYTKEEWKMVAETTKIFGDDRIAVAPTCVRVPVLRCHAESINVELNAPITLDEAKAAFKNAENVELMDDIDNLVYPMPGMLQGTDKTYVGRVRLDPTVENGIAFWCVADQIRKGAALNAVQIAELLVAY